MNVDVEKWKDVLTTVGRILYVMGKLGVTEARVSELRSYVGSGVYQALISGVKRGMWNYSIDDNKITLTEKGVAYARALAKLSL